MIIISSIRLVSTACSEQAYHLEETDAIQVADRGNLDCLNNWETNI